MKIKPPSPSAGIAMIIVMVMIFVLGILAAGFAYSMKVETKLASNTSLESDLEWLGRSGVELARYVLAQQLSIPENFDSLKQKWAGGPGNTNDALAEISLENNRVGEGIFSIKIIDMERKVNINVAGEALLQQALTLIGVDAAGFSTIVNSIQDWREPGNNSRISGAKSDYYLELNPPYVAKNGPIGDLSELLLVKGITPEMYWGPGGSNQSSQAIQPVRSIYNQPLAMGSTAVGLVDLFTAVSFPLININTASAAVLQLLPGVDANTAAGIIQARSGFDGAEGTEDDIPFQNPGELINVPGMSPQFVGQVRNLCGVRSYTFEVHVDAQIYQYKRRFVALLRRLSARDVRVLYMHWQ